MRYQNKRNGKVAEVVKKDEKFMTVLLKYVDDGTSTCISNSTFKRWWKKFDEDEVVETKTVEAEVVVKKVTEKEKEKTSSESSESDVITFVKEVASSFGLDYYIREKQPGLINFKPVDAPVLFLLYGKKNKFHLCAKSKHIGHMLGSTSIAYIDVEVKDGLFGVKFDVSDLTVDTKNCIKLIIETIVSKNKKQGGN